MKRKNPSLSESQNESLRAHIEMVDKLIQKFLPEAPLLFKYYFELTDGSMVKTIGCLAVLSELIQLQEQYIEAILSCWGQELIYREQLAKKARIEVQTQEADELSQDNHDNKSSEKEPEIQADNQAVEEKIWYFINEDYFVGNPAILFAPPSPMHSTSPVGLNNSVPTLRISNAEKN